MQTGVILDITFGALGCICCLFECFSLYLIESKATHSDGPGCFLQSCGENWEFYLSAFSPVSPMFNPLPSALSNLMPQHYAESFISCLLFVARRLDSPVSKGTHRTRSCSPVLGLSPCFLRARAIVNSLFCVLCAPLPLSLSTASTILFSGMLLLFYTQKNFSRDVSSSGQPPPTSPMLFCVQLASLSSLQSFCRMPTALLNHPLTAILVKSRDGHSSQDLQEKQVVKPIYLPFSSPVPPMQEKQVIPFCLVVSVIP